MTVTT